MTWLKLDFRDKVLKILKRKNLCPKTPNSNFIPKIFLMVIEKFPSEKKGTFLKPSDASWSISHFYYPGVTRSITTPSTWMGCLSIVKLPAFHQASLTIWQYPFINLYSWVNRGTVRVKCFAQNTTHSPHQFSHLDLSTKRPAN